MTKEEIIKQEIIGKITVYNGEKFDFSNGYKNQYSDYQDIAVVSIDKLAKFLAKYVTKEQLIEE